MTEQEFCVVTRKKWLARKSLNKRRPQYKNSAENVLQEVEIPKFLRRLQRVRDQMEASDYFQQSLSLLSECLEKLGSQQQIAQIVCFGIGPFTRSIQAFHQFGFILELQKHLHVTDAIFYDPVFRNTEREVLQTLECSIMKENCEAKYSTERLTLYYLPHCPNSLTNNLLWRNWRPEMLSKVILINNSFKSLTTSKPDRLLRLDSGYILDVLPYTEEVALDDCYDTHNIFNDLSVHIFPEANLPEKESALWTPKEAPKYEDGEMIVANGLEGLSLTENSVQ